MSQGISIRAAFITALLVLGACNDGAPAATFCRDDYDMQKSTLPTAYRISGGDYDHDADQKGTNHLRLWARTKVKDSCEAASLVGWADYFDKHRQGITAEQQDETRAMKISNDLEKIPS